MRSAGQVNGTTYGNDLPAPEPIPDVEPNPAYCSADDCQRPIKCRQLCATHYAALRRQELRQT